MNLGNPCEMTILDFAEAVRAASGSRGQLVFKPYPIDDPRRRRPDVARARAPLGWVPRVPIEQGLRETLAYFRSLLSPQAVAA